MEGQNNKHFSDILLQELNAIKVKLWAIEVEKIPIGEEILLEPTQKLEMYWDTLFSSVPQIEPYFLGPIILDRKVDLTKWINKLATYFTGEILGKSYRIFLPPEQSSPVMIWGRSNKWYLSEKVSDFDGDSYWFAIFRNLERWRQQSQVILEEVFWEIDDQEVELILIWRGPFKSIGQVEAEGPRAECWDVSFIDKDISKGESTKATSFLVNVQIGMQNGFNSFELVDLNENKLTTSLKIPRADFGEQKEISTTLSNPNINLIVDYFINLARPHYIKASRKLEMELMKEFHRWQQETEEADRDTMIAQRQKKAVNQLVSIRQTYFGNESS